MKNKKIKTGTLLAGSSSSNTHLSGEAGSFHYSKFNKFSTELQKVILIIIW
jgi:hypothetical protein